MGGYLYAAGDVTFNQGLGGGNVTIHQATGAGAGGGGSPSLEVFSNFDEQRTSPTASIAFGDAMKMTVSGSTAIVTVDFSSVTAKGNTFNTGTNLVQLSGGLIPNLLVDGSSVTKKGQDVAVLNATQTFSGQNTFLNAVTISTTVIGLQRIQWSDGTIQVSSGSGFDGNSINNQNTLQAGATFYVSSGTVNENFYAKRISGNGAALSGGGGYSQFKASGGNYALGIEAPASGTNAFIRFMQNDGFSLFGDFGWIGGGPPNDYFTFQDASGNNLGAWDSEQAARFYENSGGNYVALKASDSVTSDMTWVLPSTDGSYGQVIHTNGDGNLYFDTDDSGGGGGSSVAIQDEGSYITTVGTINFVGSGVSVALTGTSSVTVTVNGGGGGGSSTLAIATGSIGGFTGLVSSPTAIVNFSSANFTATLTVGSTAFIELSTHTTTLSQSFTVTDDGDWSNEVYPIFESPVGSSVTITQINVTSYGVGTSTIGVQFNERQFGSLSTSGVDVFSSTQQVTNSGARLTSFSNAVLAPESYLVFTTTTNASQGIINLIKGVVHYRKNR